VVNARSPRSSISTPQSTRDRVLLHLITLWEAVTEFHCIWPNIYTDATRGRTILQEFIACYVVPG